MRKNTRALQKYDEILSHWVNLYLQHGMILPRNGHDYRTYEEWAWQEVFRMDKRTAFWFDLNALVPDKSPTIEIQEKGTRVSVKISLPDYLVGTISDDALYKRLFDRGRSMLGHGIKEVQIYLNGRAIHALTGIS